MQKCPKCEHDLSAFLNSELERMERELRAKFDNKTQKDFNAELEEYVSGKLKEQEREIRRQTNIVLGDKCDEMERLLKEQEKKHTSILLLWRRDHVKYLNEQEKRLRLDEKSVLDLLCEWLECWDCTRSKLGGVAFLLCKSQEGSDG